MQSSEWGFARESMLMILESAILAPSSHNTQPWWFRVGDGVIQLLADRTRALPVNDPDDRELMISCGCALLNLRVAAAHSGCRATVHLLPDAQDPDLVAAIELEASQHGGAPDDARLHPAIPRRRTCRVQFEPRDPPAPLLLALGEAAAIEGGMLRIVTRPHERDFIAALVREGDHLLWNDPRWRRELAAWMHPRRRGDGLRIEGMPSALAQAVVRTFDMGQGIAARDAQVVQASPVLALITSHGDEPVDWIGSGQALERVLLTAAEHGLQASFLNQPIQAEALRGRLAQAFPDAGVPQILLRIGYPVRECPPAVRRPVLAVLDDIQPAQLAPSAAARRSPAGGRS